MASSPDYDALAIALSSAADWLNELADNGPDLRVNAHLKAAHEARELADDPTPIEAADVLICLVGTALQQGWTMGDLAHAVSHKVRVNATRTWVRQPDGTWQHDTPIPSDVGAP